MVIKVTFIFFVADKRRHVRFFRSLYNSTSVLCIYNVKAGSTLVVFVSRL